MTVWGHNQAQSLKTSHQQLSVRSGGEATERALPPHWAVRVPLAPCG